jgi:hypothetical protein
MFKEDSNMKCVVHDNVEAVEGTSTASRATESAKTMFGNHGGGYDHKRLKANSTPEGLPNIRRRKRN